MSESETNAQTTNTMKDVISTLSNTVTALYTYRDHYFENHSLQDASSKNDNVNNKLMETVKLFEDEFNNVKPSDRATYYYLLGRALNVGPTYNPKAEEVLSKAIKLDMKLYDAWNELGESYWKKEDIVEAKNCFQGALKYKKNKTSLRNLSMVLRMEKASTGEEKAKNVQEGMRCAKDAVEMDAQDGMSWSVLGNAYLSSFFNIAQNPSVLSLCKSAYTQAEKDIVAKSNPDLHYNRGIVAKYEEDYTTALNSFSQATRLEPSWVEPLQKRTQILNYLAKIDDLVRSKGKMNRKKLGKMLEKMNPSKNLGPYAGGKYCAMNGAEIALSHVDYADLKEGLNEEKVVLGVVVCSVQEGDNVPLEMRTATICDLLCSLAVAGSSNQYSFWQAGIDTESTFMKKILLSLQLRSTFVMVDRRENSLAVTVYNLAQGKGVLIGDYVAIPEPFLSHVRIDYENKKYAFESIRVVSPLVMVVNGRKVDKTLQCGLQFSTFSMSE